MTRRRLFTVAAALAGIVIVGSASGAGASVLSSAPLLCVGVHGSDGWKSVCVDAAE